MQSSIGETPQSTPNPESAPVRQSLTTRTKAWIATGFILLLLIIDQWIKIEVKTNMMLGDSIKVTNWFYILFTENPGMAFGWEVFNKAFLSIFRIAASLAILWLVYKICKGRFSTGFLLCVSAIFAGAVGNILDSIFYGKIFDHSVGQVATLFPENGGYADWLHGKVVDMFYFPIIEGYWPSWMPFVGGDHFLFFQPIFNFADACISVGVVVLLLFYSRSFNRLLNGGPKHEATSDVEVHQDPKDKVEL